MRLFIRKITNSKNLLIQAGAYGNNIIGDLSQILSPGEKIFEKSYNELLKLIESENYKGFIEIE